MRNLAVILVASFVLVLGAEAKLGPVGGLGAPMPLIGLGLPGIVATIGAFIATRRRK